MDYFYIWIFGYTTTHGFDGKTQRDTNLDTNITTTPLIEDSLLEYSVLRMHAWIACIHYGTELHMPYSTDSTVSTNACNSQGSVNKKARTRPYQQQPNTHDHSTLNL